MSEPTAPNDAQRAPTAPADAVEVLDSETTTRESPQARSIPAALPRSRHPSADAETVRLKLPTSAAPSWLRNGFGKLPERVREWFADPDFSIYFLVFMVVAAALFLRQPSGVGGGFVFDEQEAILANPYVRGHQPWIDAFRRDFWGLLPDRSIGSYRPIPNLLWRALWRLQEWRSKGTGASPINTPFVWFNLVFHATNAALLSTIVRGVYKKVSVAWLAGAVFCACAVLTEAISGIVGIADVLGALSLLLCLASLSLHPSLVLVSVFGATVFGLLSKESAVVNVGLVPLAAVMLAPSIDARRPWRWWRASAAFVGACAATGVYFVIRHKYFHLDLPMDVSEARDACLGGGGPAKGFVGKLAAKLTHYIGAPNLPVDPFNNPLAEPQATCAQRVAGALRVYARGVGQVIAPVSLSPDYSLPQEPLPTKIVFPESILGALLFLVPPSLGVWLWFRGERNPSVQEPVAEGYREVSFIERIRPGRRYSDERSLLAYALITWPAAFFPLSNIVKVLPTVRAERFWYTPALATSIVLAIVFAMVARKYWYAAAVFALAFLGFQGVRARMHASHFKDDLAFWEAAAKAVPNSAKAHLNYSVMLGARAVELRGWTVPQAQEARLIENVRAAELAPHWDMAFIYVGDTLCQLDRMNEAWEWYKKGFRIGPQNSGLIALALQCMSDHHALLDHEKDALAMADEKEMSGSWLTYLVRDTLDREHKCRGESASAAPDSPDYIFGEDLPDESAPPASVEASELVLESAEANASTMASLSTKPSTSGSTSGKGSASSKASGSSSTSANASSSAASSSSEDVDLEAAPVEAKPTTVLPPCGVDPKYRPRGLDGDPKGD